MVNAHNGKYKLDTDEANLKSIMSHSFTQQGRKAVFKCKCCTLILCTLSLLANSSSLRLISTWWTRWVWVQNKWPSFIMQGEAQISPRCFDFVYFLWYTMFPPPPSPAPCGRWPGPGILGCASGGLSAAACVCTPCLELYAHSWWSDKNNCVSEH